MRKGGGGSYVPSGGRSASRGRAHTLPSTPLPSSSSLSSLLSPLSSPPPAAARPAPKIPLVLLKSPLLSDRRINGGWRRSVRENVRGCYLGCESGIEWEGVLEGLPIVIISRQGTIIIWQRVKSRLKGTVGLIEREGVLEGLPFVVIISRHGTIITWQRVESRLKGCMMR